MIGYTPNFAGQLFAQSVANAYRTGFRLPDPSLALRKDPEVYELMLTDPAILQAFDRRTVLAAGMSWHIDPASDHPADKALAGIQEAALKKIRAFTPARVWLSWAIAKGTAYSRVQWARRWLPLGKDRVYREWTVPVRLEPIDRRMFRGIPVRQKDGGALVEWERFHETKAQWCHIDAADKPNYLRHAYGDDPDRLGHGRGLIDAVYFLWYFRSSLREEMLNAAEFWSRGFVEVAVDALRQSGKVNQTLVDEYTTALQAHRSRHQFIHDAKDAVTITQGNMTGAQFIQGALDGMASEIRTLINHANVNVSADKGGSYALADTQADSEQMISQLDRESLSETLSIGLTERFHELNYATLAEMGLAAAQSGKFAIVNQKVEDPKETAGMIKEAQAAGVVVPKAWAYERLGIPIPEAGEEVLVAPAPAAPSFGLPGLPPNLP